ncbi:MAG: GNAT family N-acetyltransferase, partial [Bacteroidia bacterium]|nr:GNAT family N-acetyltransferase [Bacteroidia bacterium]
RLSLREFTPGDTEFVIELVNSPDWLKFIGNRNINTEIEALDFIVNGPIKSYTENGYGLYVVELKSTNKPIGMCGIINRTFLNWPDIGFAFLPEYIGKGYGCEAAKATIEYAKNSLKLNKLCAITVANNTKSIHLLEKLDFTFSEIIILPDTKEKLQLYTNF